jgi:hypothetical protein
MRQERITKKSRRRTTRQREVTPQALPQAGADLSDADELLAQIEQLMTQLQAAA